MPGTSITAPKHALTRGVRFEGDMLYMLLDDGRELGMPLAWSERLSSANPEQRNNWELIGRGSGVHWPDVDEDISVAGLLGVPD